MHSSNSILVLPTIHNIEEVISGLSAKYKLTKGKFSQLEYILKDGTVLLRHAGRDIKEFSNVWLSSYWRSRDLAYAVKLYLKHNEISHTYVEKATSKLTDQMIFALNKLPIPNTFFIDEEDISIHLDTIEDVCKYPLIIKDITGSGGRNSALVSNREQLIEKYSELPKRKKYLFQQFIPNDYDWGILIVNGKAMSAEKSFSMEGEFLNNACNGAKEVFVNIKEVPSNITDIAIQATRLLKLNWARADIVIDKKTNKAYLMEVNRCPGISTGSSEVIGAQIFLDNHLE
jgi:biotin carboxylase